MSDVILACRRCGQVDPDYVRVDLWNAVFVDGHLLGLVCPGCQTAEENAEAVINQATLDYDSTFIDESGAARLFPKPE